MMLSISDYEGIVQVHSAADQNPEDRRGYCDEACLQFPEVVLRKVAGVTWTSGGHQILAVIYFNNFLKQIFAHVSLNRYISLKNAALYYCFRQKVGV